MKELTKFLPNPNTDSVGELQTYYTRYYQDYAEDSPEISRVSMTTRMNEAISQLPSGSLTIDIGAGKQVLEKEYKEKYGNSARIVTLDLADIQKGQLLTPDFEHITASGTQMPFNDESASLVVSNMAIDFMPRETLGEVARILKPNAQLLLNLHHPSLINWDLDRKIRTLGQKIRFQSSHLSEQQIMKMAVLEHKKYLRDEHILYESIDQIRSTFKPFGFEVTRVEQVFGGDTWWEADMIKK